MNNLPPSDPRPSYPSQDGPAPRPVGEAEKADDFNLSEFLGNVWEGRWLIFSAVLVCLAVGLVYTLSVTPVYQMDGLLQTETQKNYGTQGTQFTKMEGVYAQSTVAEAEIEILKSNLVLGRVVTNLNLDIEAGPVLPPILGKFLNRNPQTRPAIDIESLEVPDVLRGKSFRLVAAAQGKYQWFAPDGTPLGQGRPGDRLVATLNGSQVRLKVRSLRAKPGQEFGLKLSPLLDAITLLRLRLTVEERGRNANAPSNILGVSLQDTDPVNGANILNEILNQYIRQAIERKSGDSAKALELLQAQRPILQAQLSDAEGRLGGFRQQAGALDPTQEGNMYLQEGSSLETQISALRQKRQELLRTYTEHSDLVVTLDQQIAHLQAESKKVEQKVTSLPRTQQEIVRLTRDAQLKSEAYTTLLTSIQQLQNTLAGSLGNARVVDYAIPSYDAVFPKKKALMSLFLFIGFVVGLGCTYLRRMLHRGVEDHRLIEAKLGMQVLVTIPHTTAQKDFSRNIMKQLPGPHLLAVGDPEDMATESLRSLRTVLHFTMENAGNRIVLITGPAPNIGKSFVSMNLAAVLAQGGSSVLLVDADLRRGSLHRTFGIKGRAGGLTEVLMGRGDWKSLTKDTGIPRLQLLSTGVLPPDPLVLLMSPQFSSFCAEVSDAYDFVIIDAPPLLPVTDSIVIGSKADTILLVAKYGAHPLDELRTCQQRLKNLSGRLKGCIFNDIKLVGYKGLYGYYKYEFDYKYHRGGA